VTEAVLDASVVLIATTRSDPSTDSSGRSSVARCPRRYSPCREPLLRFRDLREAFDSCPAWLWPDRLRGPADRRPPRSQRTYPPGAGARRTLRARVSPCVRATRASPCALVARCPARRMLSRHGRMCDGLRHTRGGKSVEPDLSGEGMSRIEVEPTLHAADFRRHRQCAKAPLCELLPVPAFQAGGTQGAETRAAGAETRAASTAVGIDSLLGQLDAHSGIAVDAPCEIERGLSVPGKDEQRHG